MSSFLKRILLSSGLFLVGWVGFFSFPLSALAAPTCFEVAQSKYGPEVVESGTCKTNCEAGDEVISGAPSECDTNPDNKKACCWVRKAASATTVSPPISVASTPVFDPLKGIGLIGLLNRLITGFLSIVGALALLVFVYAGVMYMASGSSEARLKNARDTMKYGAIGLAIIIFAYTITRVYFRVLIEEPPAVPAQQAAPVAPAGS